MTVKQECVVLEEANRQQPVSDGLHLEMRQPGFRPVHSKYLVHHGEDRRNVRLDGAHRAIHWQTHPGKPTGRVAVNQRPRSNIERSGSASLLHERQCTRCDSAHVDEPTLLKLQGGAHRGSLQARSVALVRQPTQPLKVGGDTGEVLLAALIHDLKKSGARSWNEGLMLAE